MDLIKQYCKIYKEECYDEEEKVKYFRNEIYGNIIFRDQTISINLKYCLTSNYLTNQNLQEKALKELQIELGKRILVSF